jgi:hypothetical protein
MLGLYAIFKALLVIIWIVDILNIDFVINGTHVAEFLDVTVPLNGWFWLLVWLLVPTVTELSKKED